MVDGPSMLRCIPCVTTGGMVGQSFSSAAHMCVVSTSLGRQVALSPPVSAGPRRPAPPSTTSATRLNPRHAS
eukprot:2256340-Prymnesium_polylepis.1